jgi:hypothetical protein
MNEKQVWLTIALDLKRAANYLHANKKVQAEYYLSEAKNLFARQKLNASLKKIRHFIRFDGQPEEILLGGSLILTRVSG